jgi:catalase
MLPEAARSGAEGFEFINMQNKAKRAELARKEAKFRPSMPQERLVSFDPEIGVYNL